MFVRPQAKIRRVLVPASNRFGARFLYEHRRHVDQDIRSDQVFDYVEHTRKGRQLMRPWMQSVQSIPKLFIDITRRHASAELVFEQLQLRPIGIRLVRT